MRKIIAILLLTFFSYPAFALLSLELTRGVAGALPIAVLPFEGASTSTDIAKIIADDLKNSGKFNVMDKSAADNKVTGTVKQLANNKYQISFQLVDSFKTSGKALLSRQFTVSDNQLRTISHHISDLVFEYLTGIRGVFSTKIAYVLVQRYTGGRARYTLEISDQDGFAPKPLLSSNDPIMSPAWSSNGRQIAYVSFENQHAAIYIQDLATGSRRLISEFPGINGAPAWSPNGKKLALVLSKSGSPNIYTLDLGNHHLTQITNDFYINTEPAWSPDGHSLIFTSNKSGSPQIYQINLESRAVSRLTYDGKYNARASFSRDGNHIVVLNQTSGVFNIGLLDLNNGNFRVLTNTGNDSESPTLAPNGSMVLFGTLDNGKSVLSMVSSDASVELKLPARNGEVQDPAWSPFLS